MKRRAIHVAFAVATTVLAALACYDWAMLRHARTVSIAVREVASQPAAKAGANANADDAPEVRLARAVLLSRAGRPNEAQHLFDALIAQDDDRAMQAAALFDLGNMNLREAAGPDAAGPIRSLPLLEQAKERYRAALRLSADDASDRENAQDNAWDARYNLERALWLAPELPGDQEQLDVKKQSSVKLHGAQSDDLP